MSNENKPSSYWASAMHWPILKDQAEYEKYLTIPIAERLFQYPKYSLK
jgi:hypothetical protein